MFFIIVSQDKCYESLERLISSVKDDKSSFHIEVQEPPHKLTIEIEITSEGVVLKELAEQEVNQLYQDIKEHIKILNFQFQRIQAKKDTCIEQLKNLRSVFLAHYLKNHDLYVFLQNHSSYQKLFAEFDKKFAHFNTPKLQKALENLFLEKNDTNLANYLSQLKNMGLLQLLAQELPEFMTLKEAWDNYIASLQETTYKDDTMCRAFIKTNVEYFIKKFPDNFASYSAIMTKGSLIIPNGVLADLKTRETLFSLAKAIAFNDSRLDSAIDALNIIEPVFCNEEGPQLLLRRLKEIGENSDLSLSEKKTSAKKLINNFLPKITSNKAILKLSEIIEQKHTSFAYLREEQAWWRFNGHGNTKTWSTILSQIKAQIDKNVARCADETLSRDEYSKFSKIMNEHRGRGFGSVTHSRLYWQLNEWPADQEEFHVVRKGFN
jgi:hypothetical protein